MFGGVFRTRLIGNISLAEDLFKAIDFNNEGDLLREAVGLSHDLLILVWGKRIRIAPPLHGQNLR